MFQIRVLELQSMLNLSGTSEFLATDFKSNPRAFLIADSFVFRVKDSLFNYVRTNKLE